MPGGGGGTSPPHCSAPMGPSHTSRCSYVRVTGPCILFGAAFARRRHVRGVGSMARAWLPPPLQSEGSSPCSGGAAVTASSAPQPPISIHDRGSGALDQATGTAAVMPRPRSVPPSDSEPPPCGKAHLPSSCPTTHFMLQGRGGPRPGPAGRRSGVAGWMRTHVPPAGQLLGAGGSTARRGKGAALDLLHSAAFCCGLGELLLSAGRRGGGWAKVQRQRQLG